MDRPKQELTTMQEAFIDAFIEYNFDPIKAYDAAGYADTSKFKYQAAVRMLKNPAIVAGLQERLTKQAPSHWITEDVILSKLWKEATDYGKGSSQTARINALVWIGKHFGMFKEKEKEEKEVSYNIINYSVTKEDIEKEVKKPEVIEYKDKVNLPEGVIVADYSEPKSVKNGKA